MSVAEEFMGLLKKNKVRITELCLKKYLYVHGYAGRANSGLAAIRHHVMDPAIHHFNALMRGLCYNHISDGHARCKSCFR